jgi:hypothetical protein
MYTRAVMQSTPPSYPLHRIDRSPCLENPRPQGGISLLRELHNLHLHAEPKHALIERINLSHIPHVDQRADPTVGSTHVRKHKPQFCISSATIDEGWDASDERLHRHAIPLRRAWCCNWARSQIWENGSVGGFHFRFAREFRDFGTHLKTANLPGFGSLESALLWCLPIRKPKGEHALMESLSGFRHDQFGILSQWAGSGDYATVSPGPKPVGADNECSGKFPSKKDFVHDHHSGCAGIAGTDGGL